MPHWVLYPEAGTLVIKSISFPEDGVNKTVIVSYWKKAMKGEMFLWGYPRGYPATMDPKKMPCPATTKNAIAGRTSSVSPPHGSL